MRTFEIIIREDLKDRVITSRKTIPFESMESANFPKDYLWTVYETALFAFLKELKKNKETNETPP